MTIVTATCVHRSCRRRRCCSRSWSACSSVRAASTNARSTSVSADPFGAIQFDRPRQPAATPQVLGRPGASDPRLGAGLEVAPQAQGFDALVQPAAQRVPGAKESLVGHFQHPLAATLVAHQQAGVDEPLQDRMDASVEIAPTHGPASELTVVGHPRQPQQRVA